MKAILFTVKVAIIRQLIIFQRYPQIYLTYLHVQHHGDVEIHKNTFDQQSYNT